MLLSANTSSCASGSVSWGYTTGVLIGILHNDYQVARVVESDRRNSSEDDTPCVTEINTYETEDNSQSIFDTDVSNVDNNDISSEQDRRRDEFVSANLMIIILSFSGTAIYVSILCSILLWC